MLTLTCLGSSSGVPTRMRNVSALAVQPGRSRGWFLFDCGEGTQQRLQRTSLSLHALVAICISHQHGDHCYGLPGLLAGAALGRRKEPLTLVAPLPVWEWLQNTRALTDLHLTYELVHVDPAAQKGVFVHGDITIEAHALRHRVPSHAYRLREQSVHRRLRADVVAASGLPRGPAWRALQCGEDVEWAGQRLRSTDFVERQQRSSVLVIGGDNAEPALLRVACAGAQVLVHEATYTQAALAKVGPGPMHSCAHDVAAFAQDAGVPNLLLTHFSPRHHGPVGQAALQAEAEAVYGGRLFMAQDLAAYRLDDAGVLSVQPMATRGNDSGTRR